MHFIQILLIFCAILNNVVNGENYPEIQIESGIVRGAFKYSHLNSKKYVAYEGIPYAKPPVGKRRFEPPELPKPWPGVLISRKPNTCLQYPQRLFSFQHELEGEEDCLYINVYTPLNTKEGANLDVIVHIHGGAFSMGNSLMFGPGFLIEHGIIFVCFNYRLGPLGFLSTEDGIVPGNNGMKDQVMALKWIKNNIHHFGGNPDSITITGISAGGASVHYHYLSPMSRGLFKQGISVSGTVLNPWTLSRGNLVKAKKLGDSVGCPTENTKEMIKCMKTRTATQIVANVAQFMAFHYNPFTPFGVVVEKSGSKPFLAEHPYQMLKAGKVQDLPWLTSNAESEGLYPAAKFIKDPSTLQDIDTNWTIVAPHLLDYNYTVDVDGHESIANSARQYYLKYKTIDTNSFDDLVQLLGDRLFVAGGVDASVLQSKFNKSPVYYYHFKYRGKTSLSAYLSGSNVDYGAAHGDEVIYLLPGFLELDNYDTPMVELMLNMWISFVKTGKPQAGDIDWEPVSDDIEKLIYLEIKSPTKLAMKTSDQLGEIEFWKNLIVNEIES